MFDRTKNAADRVRPILHAMEQSISAARQRRVQRTAPTAPLRRDEHKPELNGEMARQLKARPKRPATFLNGS